MACNVRMCASYVAYYFDVIFLLYFHQQALIEACEKGNIDDARQQLGKGADVDSKDNRPFRVRTTKF